MSSRMLERGTFAETPVAQLLLKGLEERWTGKLELRREKLHKIVCLENGWPIFVQSSHRSEALAQLLIRRGKISEADHAQVLAEAQAHGLKYGQALVRLELMTEQQVVAELLLQTRYKLVTCLRWQAGSWTFEADAEIARRVPRCRIDPVGVVFGGLGRTFDVDEAMARWHDEGTGRPLKLLERFERYRDRFVRTFGGETLGLVAAGRTVSELLDRPDFPRVVLQLDVLFQCQLAELDSHPAGARGSNPPETIPLDSLVILSPEEEDEADMPPAAADAAHDHSVVQLQPAALLETARPAAIKPPNAQQVEQARQLIQYYHLHLDDDPYRVLGVIPETGLAGFEVAYEIKRKQLDPQRFTGMDLGEQAAQLQVVLDRLDEAFAVLSNPDRRADFDAHQHAVRDPEPPGALTAEECFHEGEALFEAGDYAAAAEKFSRAASLDEQADYVVRGVLARFLAGDQSTEDAIDAMVTVQGVLEQHPELVDGHLVAAALSRAVANDEEAIAHLQTALRIEPGNRHAFELLEELLRETGRLQELEKAFRRTIHRLGARERNWTGTLWARLVDLYRDELGDEDKARLACDVALRYLPDDRELRRHSAELSSVDPARWQDAVCDFRALVQADPKDPNPLRAICEIHRQGQRLDAAYVAASAAVLLDHADEDQLRIYQRLRPTSRPALGRTLYSIESLCHPDDDLALGLLFEALAPLILGTHPPERRAAGAELPATRPPTFTRVLAGLCETLATPRPALRLLSTRDDGVEVLAGSPPTLLIGSAVLGSADEVELCYRLARALVLAMPGRVIAAHWPIATLKAYVVAALAAAYPQLDVPTEGDEMRAIRAGIDATPEVTPAVRRIVTSLRRQIDQLNLANYQRGVRRTAERAGLVLCGDLVVAGRTLAGDRQAQLELVDFALSAAHSELRRDFGIAHGADS